MTLMASKDLETMLECHNSQVGETLQFMPRFSIPAGTGTIDFQGGGSGGDRRGHQQLGLGMSETNLGMLAALNAYRSSTGSGHHQQSHQQTSLDQRQRVSDGGGDSGGDQENSSQ